MKRKVSAFFLFYFFLQVVGQSTFQNFPDLGFASVAFPPEVIIPDPDNNFDQGRPFGAAIVGGNVDGTEVLFVGNPDLDPAERGGLHIYSFPNGQLNTTNREITFPQQTTPDNSNFGRSLLFLGDMNGDGRPEILGGFSNRRRLLHLSIDPELNPIGVSVIDQEMNPLLSRWGLSLASDLRGPVPRVFIGGTSNENRYIVYVNTFDFTQTPPTFTQLYTIDIQALAPGSIQVNSPDSAAATNLFGESIAFLGDINGDGFDEIAISHPNYDANGNSENSGAVFIFTLQANQAILISEISEARGFLEQTQGIAYQPFFGSNPSFADAIFSSGDLNRDGLVDLFVTVTDAPTSNTGLIYILSLDSEGVVQFIAPLVDENVNLAVGTRLGESFAFFNNRIFATGRRTIADPTTDRWNLYSLNTNICGNGIITTTNGVGEECDDGNAEAGDGCDTSCVAEAGFICQSPGELCVSVCGDGLVVSEEACDDGNPSDGDGCSSNCVEEEGFICRNFDDRASECTRDGLTRAEIAGIVVSVVFVFCCLFSSLFAVGVYLRSRNRSQADQLLIIPEDVPLLDEVQVLEQIGSGNFGVVYYGKWKGSEVALKSLEAVSETTSELSLLSELRNPHIISFYGVYKHEEQYFMVTEYMDKKDLLSFLQSTPDLKKKDLLDFAKQTLQGMEFLHSRNILHRDLAARNLLLSKPHKYTLKIADFGLSRKSENYYVQQTTSALPIRWTAPEAIQYGKASPASDVWAFGVVVFEIFSRGAIPYAGMTNKQVFEKVKSGHRLKTPSECPQELAQLMKSCWEITPSDRPSFSTLLEKFLAVKQWTYPKRIPVPDKPLPQLGPSQQIIALENENKKLRDQIDRLTQFPPSAPESYYNNRSADELYNNNAFAQTELYNNEMLGNDNSHSSQLSNSEGFSNYGTPRESLYNNEISEEKELDLQLKSAKEEIAQLKREIEKRKKQK